MGRTGIMAGRVCFVGESTGGKSGNYVKSDGVLVVNRNVSNLQAVAAYLECVLCDEVQYLAQPAWKESVKKVVSDGTPVMDSIKTADVIDNSSFILTKTSTCSRLKEKDYNK